MIVVGGIENSATAEIFDLGPETWTTVISNFEGRGFHSATLLSDGKVLVSGGLHFNGSIYVPLTSTELYDPATTTWSTVGPLNEARGGHTATLLADGKVLVAGGAESELAFPIIDSAELYDPETQLWTTTGALIEARAIATATLLANGNVLLSGGYDGGGMKTAELYDPVAGMWSATAELSDPRANHTATLMPDGKVLVAGGFDAGLLFINSAEFFDPGTGTWSSAGSFVGTRHVHTATLLSNGKVLVAGGFDGFYLVGGFDGVSLGSAELLDTVSSLVMASNEGTADLTMAQAAGFIYHENDPNEIGYNSNEEHAVKFDGRFFALRDDLNDTTLEGYTSEPYVLVAYTDPDDGRPAMRPFRVLREDSRHSFNYPWTAGTRILGPMPLPRLPLPLGQDGAVANTEVPGVPDPTDTAPEIYDSFTFEDRQGFKWVYRGPHAGGSPTLGMQWYYPMRTEFFIPGVVSQPAEGVALPYLRPLDEGGVPQGDPVDGTALTVSYTPTWPESSPSLRIAETLTLPRFGLPDVRNQKSAEVFYEQSIAEAGTTKNSVTLHDPTRTKSVDLADVGLEEIPESIRTTSVQGKTYFQGLPPHLQTRFYLDPLAGSRGSLILAGEFHDEIAGEDYLDLNVLSVEDENALKALADNEDSGVQTQWDNAIDGLQTRLETFIEDSSRQGTYIVDSEQTLVVQAYALPEMPDSDTARDSYALTATGQGAGYVTLVFNDGVVPDLTPQGDPPVMQIIMVVPELYSGDLKVRFSGNPLDEQVTLRHSGDFAAKPEGYEFEWRHAPPTANGTQPPIYTYTNDTFLGDPGDPGTRAWKYLQNSSSDLPSVNAYSVGDWLLARQIAIKDVDYDPSGGLPGVVLRAKGGVDFSAEIPARITFSAELGNLDGFVLYVNGSIALVHGNGVAALEELLSENAYELRLLRADDPDDLPVEGETLVVVADVAGVLHFRIFDASGSRVIDTDETQLPGSSAELLELEGRLSNLWATTNLLNSDKAAVVAATAAIVGFDLDTDAATGLSATGLSKQFSVNEGFFLKGLNDVEVALFTEADHGVLSTVDIRLEGSTRTDEVLAPGTPWQLAGGPPSLLNTAIVGGSPSDPLGSPLLVLSDNFFTMRYRPLMSSGNILAQGYAAQGEVPWSNWTRPALVEGWIKRVLAAINPFNQHMTDLFNNAVNTDVSLLTQAGTKWEGDIALTLEAINDFGLIAIYETVLNRGKGISIDAGFDYGPANDALLLAAGYLHDLYTILGNEAFADAANPTISIDDQTTITEVNTSRFSFEGQVASVLDEELSLLRGRDDFLSPQVTQSPFYNRLFWNYTRGIDSGEAIYATNYNIKEKVGSSTEDGSIDAADAQ